MLKYFSKVWFILKGSRKKLPLLLFTFILSSLLEALGIGLIGPFLNLASHPDSLSGISILTWLYKQFHFHSSNQFVAALGFLIAIIFCIKSCLYFLAQTYIYNFSFIHKGKLISRLLNTYLSITYSFYLHKNTATLIKNVLYETMMITNGCLLPLLNTVANLVVLIVILLLLAKTDMMFLILILAIMLPTFIFFYRLKNKFKTWGKISSDAQQEMVRIINHGLGSLKETRVIGCEGYFQKQMEEQVKRYEQAATKFHSFNILPRITIETLLIVFTLLFISVSQLIFASNIQNITSVMAVFAVASIRLIPVVSQSVQAMGQLQNSSHAVDVIYLDLKEIEKQDFIYQIVISQPQKSHSLAFKNQIELQHVSYCYPGASEAALNDVCLTIKKGQSIALIGKSGAGKTTLVDVLLGLLNPQGGDIKVDNISIYQDIRSWQNLIGYIPQSIFLIDDTIERNIAFGVPDRQINLEKLNTAIKSAQLEELVEQLPKGIKTAVGERGVRLSGGQRQRIGIARALYHEREILVLDEATSALDNETEKLVTQAINSLAGKKTLIVIAHRLSTVENCDRIYLLEKGRVVKSGSFQEVL
jgi:ABC-type multidrug transport system fused ATPase/permease subunit